MKTSNIQQSHNHAIIAGWVDGTALTADASGGGDGQYENSAGVSLATGDVVVMADDGTVTRTSSAQDTRPVGIVLDDIDDGDFGPVAWQGPVDFINVGTAVTAGYYAETSATAGQAQANVDRRTGSFGYFTSAGITPSGFLFGGGGGSGSGPYELNIEGGQDTIAVHGAMGSTETFDPTDGNVHTGTLDANCTFTLNAPTGSGAATLELWITGSGTRTWTWPGSVTWDGGVTGSPPASGATVRVILETIDGGTNWIANMVGGVPAHAASHENGGSDEIDVTGLTGAGGGSGNLAGTELDYAEVTSDVSVTTVDGGGFDTVLTGNAVAYDGSTVVMIEFYANAVQVPNTASNNYIYFVLFDGATQLGNLAISLQANSTTIRTPVHAMRRLTPSAATHTYHVKAAIGASGTGTVRAGNGGSGNAMPTFIRITRVTS